MNNTHEEAKGYPPVSICKPGLVWVRRPDGTPIVPVCRKQNDNLRQTQVDETICRLIPQIHGELSERGPLRELWATALVTQFVTRPPHGDKHPLLWRRCHQVSTEAGHDFELCIWARLQQRWVVETRALPRVFRKSRENAHDIVTRADLFGPWKASIRPLARWLAGGNSQP